MGYLLIVLFAGTIGAAKLWNPPTPPAFVGISSSQIPTRIGSFYSLGDEPIDPTTTQALSTADIIGRTYADGVNQVGFVLIGGTDRGALHDPRSCLIGAGWSLENDHTEPLPGTNIDVHCVHAVGGDLGKVGLDIMYVYLVNHKIVDQVTQIRAAMLISGLLGRQNTPVYFMRFIVPDNGNGGLDPGSHAAMQRLAAGMWTQLHGKLETS